MQVKIPVHRPYIGKEELNAVAKVFDSRWLGLGSITRKFEEMLREFIGVKHVIAVSSGSSALHLTLASLSLKSDDEVIVPALTYVSSVQAIVTAGARPVFCEVKEDTLNIDISDAFNKVTTKTKAILPVHYGGLACSMDELLKKAREYSLWVVEDAAQAFGSTYKGQKVGTLSDVTCFSFDPIKNITCGDGGAIVTDNDEFARKIKPMHNVGIDENSRYRKNNERDWFYSVISTGYRYYLSNLNAAIGIEQFKKFYAFKERKQSIVRYYDEKLREIEGVVIPTHNWNETFPFSYVIRVLNKKRDVLMNYLKEKGVGTTVQFTPNHLQPAFADFHVPLPITEKLYEEILTLPLYFEMTDDDVETVIDAVRSFFY